MPVTNLIHGHNRRTTGKTGTYRSWEAMRRCCEDSNHTSYKNYGGKGVKVCDRWSSFSNFLEDMGEKPEGYSINRKNNKLGYSLGNCEWATREQQDLNSSQTRPITYKGVTKSISGWSRAIGIGYSTLYGHLFYQGKTLEEVCSYFGINKSVLK